MTKGKEDESQSHSSSIEWQARRRRIILHATESFLLNGYTGTSLDDVAVQAGVGKPTIYQIFKDKYGLSAAVLKDFCTDLERACGSAIDMDSPPEECLVKLGETYTRWMLESVGKTHRYAVSRLLLEVSGPHPDFAQVWREEHNKALFFPLSEYIKRRIEIGDMIGDDPYFIAAQFMGSVYHPANSLIAENDFNRNIALIRKKVQLFLRGCTPPAG